jgi:L-malate glycosyltransferase
MFLFFLHGILPMGVIFSREHSRALSEAGADVMVVAGVYTSIKQFPFLNPLNAFEVNLVHEPGFLQYIYRFWRVPKVDATNTRLWIRMMMRLVTRHLKNQPKPDIIQVHSCIWAGMVAAEISRLFNIPYVITEHRSRFVFNTAEARAMFKPWHNAYLQKAFSGASKIITVSSSLNNKILEFAPHKADSILSVPNQVDTDFFSPPKQKPEKGKAFTFFSLANHTPVKGFDILLRAFSRTNPGLNNLRLIIGGQGELTPELKQLAMELRLQEHVDFIGGLNRDQVRYYMQNADAFVLASRFEAFGVVFIEAMASGLPVIAARAGGPETFITESTGILVNPDDAMQLSEAMLALKENYNRWHCKNIRNYAVENFSKQSVARRYMDIYQSIIVL